MKVFDKGIKLSESITLGAGKMVLIGGPCVVESYEICSEIAGKLKEYCDKIDISYVFKASFDKANRTSSQSFRSKGFEESLKVLEKIGKQFDLPLITDVHESYQIKDVSEVVDVLQIPAFLCRQTDLLVAAGKSKCAVNIKKGQFMAPEDMQYAVNKVTETGNDNVCLTERGSSFGYHNLVVDMRSLPIMRQYCPVIFDVTHSVQQPGGMGGSSGGKREFAPYLAKAAAAVGVDGFFVETHPDPSKALSDGPNMIPLDQMGKFLNEVKSIWKLSK